MAIDVVGVQQLLQATGPVVADGRTVTADNVEQFLLHDQYAGLNSESSDSGQRQDALGVLATAVVTQLQGQSTDLRSLASAMAGRRGRTTSDGLVEEPRGRGRMGDERSERDPHPEFGGPVVDQREWKQTRSVHLHKGDGQHRHSRDRGRRSP